MIPVQGNDREPRDGLAGLSDFDLPYAYQNLKAVSGDSPPSVWKTPLWQNLLAASLAVIIGLVVWTAWQYDPFSQQTSLLAKVVLGVVGFLFCSISVALGLFSLMRGQLVLERELRELRFFRFWFSIRPHRRICIDEIESLSHRSTCSPGNTDDQGHAYDILVARLKDQRLASIAIDSCYSIEKELKAALGSDQL